MKNRLLYYILFGFMIPPAVWIGIVYYSQIFTLENMYSIIFSPAMILYILFVTAAGIFFFHLQLKHVEATIDKQQPDEKTDAILAKLPLWFLLIQFLYTSFGPFVVLKSLDFVSTQQFYLAQIFTLPLVLLFVIPAFISFVTQLESWTKSINLSIKHPFISFSKKILFVIFNTLLGSILLIVFYNITIYFTMNNLEFASFLYQNIVISLVALGIALINIYLLVKQIKNSILQITTTLSSNSNDLNKYINIDSRDETGIMAASINHFIFDLKDAIADAKNASNSNIKYAVNMKNISQKTKEKVNIGFELAKDTILTADNIQHIVEISSQNFENTQLNMQEAYNFLNNAKEAIYNLIKHINNSVELEYEMKIKLEQLTTQTKDIQGVLNIINDISDKTNLLALNAAIEAARAGEHGRGFAVVADEVRQLAEGTQKNITEINAITNIIINSANDASGQMEQNAQKIQKLAKISTEVEEDINTTVDKMQTTNDLAKISGQSAQKISIQTNKMLDKIKQMNEISTINYKNTDELSKIADSLNQSSNDLNTKLEYFKT